MSRNGAGSPTTFGNEAGFTLLEGLVAIALLASVLMALLGLLGGLLSSAHRIGQSNRAQQFSLNALEAMSIVNPMVRASGEIDLGDCLVKWTSTTLTPISDGVGYPLGTSLYQLALYDTDVRIEQEGSLIEAFKLRQVGYRRVREPPSPFPRMPGISERVGPVLPGSASAR